MAKGKNQKTSKRGNAAKKHEKHPFTKKKWYKMISPPTLGNSVFIGYTPVNKTIGTKLSKDFLMNRVCEVSYSDIKENCSHPYKKIKMQVEEVKSGNCYSSFYGIDMTREKLYTFLRKRMTLIDAFVDVKTNDGYILRCFITTFTAKKSGQLKSNCYAKSTQVRAIRKIICKHLSLEAQKLNIDQFASNVLSNSFIDELQKKSQNIFPLGHMLIRKVKVLKKSKIDINKLVNDANQSKGNDAGQKQDQAKEAKEAQNTVV